MTKKAEREAERANAREQLRKLCPPGTTVYCVLEHVSRSGMTREIKLYALQPDVDCSRPYPDALAYLSGYVSHALDYAKRGKRDGNVVSGCGMDMGFHLVSNLSHALYPHGFGCIGEGCPSNDHSNGDHDYTPHGGTCPSQGDCECEPVPNSESFPDSLGHGHWHNSGDYALRHRWL